MKILEKIKESDCICITPNAYKKKILEGLSKESQFCHIEFITKEELKTKLLYEYSSDALWNFSKQFHMIPENGAIILEALYYILDNQNFPNLYQQKEWLKEKKLLIYHSAFNEYIKNKKVIIYGYKPYEMKFFEQILENVEYVEEEVKTYLPSITEYETLEEEVVGVAEEISKLLQEGISINHIYLGEMNNDYSSTLSKIFHYFHIPFARKKSHTLFEYQMIQTFLKHIVWDEPLSKLEELLEVLKEEYPIENDFNQQIYEQLITIFNRYYNKNRLFSEIKEILLYDLKHTNVKGEVYRNVVKEVDFKNSVFEEDDYIFLLGANLGEFPSIYEDTDYFSDEQKKLLFLPTSLEKTIGEEEKIKQKIESYPHVFVSYKKKNPFKEFLPAPFIEYYKEVKKVDITLKKYQYSNHYYNEYLLNSALDEFVNFNVKNNHLNTLYGIENLYYNSYDNQFTGISEDEFRKRISYVLLSYTGMQKFFECPFKYYVGSILKITPPYEETPSLIVGNLFHTILERYFQNKEKIEEIIIEELNKIEIAPISKKEFYFNKYENEIKRLIDVMEAQLSRSSFKPTYFEEKIEWLEKKQITFCIFGKIDKIMTFSDEKNCYVIVIDYKTGAASNDLSKVIYGMDMQLLLYLYLISNDKRFDNFKLGGAYIESISSSIPNYTEGKTLEDLLWEQSKLDGISLKRMDYVKALDQNCELSSYVKGIRIKQDGDFYSSKRLLDEHILEQLLEVVKSKIEEVEKAIENAEFPINPKKFESEFGNKVSSCAYCHYRDICYLKMKNVTTLKEYDDLEFLGGEKV